MKTTFDEEEHITARRTPALQSGEGVKFEKTITINRPISEVYAFWRDLENLPSFMTHLDSVTVTSGTTSHWVVRTTEKKTMEWDAEIIEDRRDELISWRSLPDSEIHNAGSVWFSEAVGNRGTVLKVALKYSPPGGKFVATIAKMFGKDGKTFIEDDLFRLKALLETGEIPTIEGQPRGNQNPRNNFMKALCWHGKHDLRVEKVPDPEILNPHDAIVRITTSAICGSDLHLYDGCIPRMEKGDILGHEFMGEVVELGKEVKNLKKGDRVVVPFTMSCGQCFFCERDLFSLCDNTNPSARECETLNGYVSAGLYGYSHLYGGYAGGQAQFARVPFANIGPIKIPDGLPDEKVIFLSDIFPTGYMAAENCNIQPGDTVAVWGCGPVGQFAIRSAFLLGAERVIAIDNVPERLEMARAGGAHTVSSESDVFEVLKEMTGGMGPDSCIDAVGMEAHGATFDDKVDRVKQAVKLSMDRPHVLRQALHSCRKGGTVSVPGVYAGFLDKIPFGMVVAKALTIKSGQTHVQKYMQPLLDKIIENEIDPSFVITHRLGLEDAPEAYKTFRDKKDKCIKVILKPQSL